MLAPLLQQVGRTWVRFRNMRLSYFGGCDYYRLSSHPAVVRALHDGLRQFGLSVAASRKTTGNHWLYEALEKQLAAFFDTESAVLLSNGYVTNMVAAQALAGAFSHVLIDSKAHSSLKDAAPFFEGSMVTFAHRDTEDLARKIRSCGQRAKPILLTDGMFAHDGSIAPLRDYLAILPRKGMILVDDAHGAGTVGRTGQGTPEQEGVPRDRIIQTVALSKAFGVYGGAILCANGLAKKIFTGSSLFNGNTPLPLPLAWAVLQAVAVLKSDRNLRRRLMQNTDGVKTALRAANLPVQDTPSPIIQVVPAGWRKSAMLKRELLAAEVYPTLIHYAGGPGQGYFRFAISSEHTQRQLNRLVGVLVRSARGASAQGKFMGVAYVSKT
ncbi:MAG: pyridoxal phosphate-dependent aminotransferase family protein [Verrucomicrobiota bacterium]